MRVAPTGASGGEALLAPAPGERVLDMPSGLFWFRSDGVAVAVHTERRVPFSAMEAVFGHMSARTTQARVPFIIDMRIVLFVDPSLRRLGTTGAEMVRYFSSVALVVGGPVSRLIGRLIVAGARGRFAPQITTDVGEALRWSLERRPH